MDCAFVLPQGTELTSLTSFHHKTYTLSQDFTFVCPTEIIAFSDRSAEFRKINCQVIAASTGARACVSPACRI